MYGERGGRKRSEEAECRTPENVISRTEEEALHLITVKVDPADKSQRRHVQHTYTVFSLKSLFPRALLPYTLSETRTGLNFLPPGQAVKEEQSDIYVLPFVFVLEAPRVLSSILAQGNYIYTPPISPPITAL